MMTWSRRYLVTSPCGSSLVLMMGRFSVVSSPTSSSKKSARWVSWKGTAGRPFSDPTFPAPVIGWRVTQEGGEVLDDLPEGKRPGQQVVLVGAV